MSTEPTVDRTEPMNFLNGVTVVTAASVGVAALATLVIVPRPANVVFAKQESATQSKGNREPTRIPPPTLPLPIERVAPFFEPPAPLPAPKPLVPQKSVVTTREEPPELEPEPNPHRRSWHWHERKIRHRHIRAH